MCHMGTTGGEVELWSPTPSAPLSLVLHTDVSQIAWGLHLQDFSATGMWSSGEREFHIIASKMKVVHLVLMNDNTTVVAYLKSKEGRCL